MRQQCDSCAFGGAGASAYCFVIRPQCSNKGSGEILFHSWARPLADSNSEVPGRASVCFASVKFSLEQKQKRKMRAERELKMMLLAESTEQWELPQIDLKGYGRFASI